MTQILLESVVSAKDGRPWVALRWGDQRGQLTPAEARQHALAVLEVAEAAEQDAFLVQWLQRNIGGSLEAAAQVLAELRVARGRWRDEQDDGNAEIGGRP